jgi:homoserine dehydrogenase
LLLLILSASAPVRAADEAQVKAWLSRELVGSVLPMAEVETSYYLRLQAQDRPGVLADVTRILADREISIEALLQKEPAPGASDVPIILLTPRVQERRMNEAIAAIEALHSIRAPVTRIRLEPLDSA